MPKPRKTKKPVKSVAQQEYVPRPKQKVHFGHLRNGQPGLFTGNTLVTHLCADTEDSIEAARKVAERGGFEFEENHHLFYPEGK
jgi:hypothetical protein